MLDMPQSSTQRRTRRYPYLAGELFLFCCGHQLRLPFETSRVTQCLRFVGGFPGEVGIGTPEVAVCSRLAIDRTAQVEAFDDALGRQLEILTNQLLQGRRIHRPRAERLNQHADRLGDADGISQLHFATPGEAGGYDVLDNVARHVGGRTVHLCRILATEGAAAVTSHTTVGVYDNFPPG